MSCYTNKAVTKSARQRLCRINQRIGVLIESGTGCSRKKGSEKGKATLCYQECVYDLLKEKADTSNISKGTKNKVSEDWSTSNQCGEEVIEHLKHTQKGDISWSCGAVILHP